jgi:hypothetical protein
VERFGDHVRPIHFTNWAAPGDRLLNSPKFCLVLRFVHDLEPIQRLKYGPCRQRQIVAEIAASPQTPPAPILGALYKLGAQRIPLNVAQECQQVCLRLNRDGPVPVLVYRASAERPMCQVPALGMRAGQPMHEIREMSCRRANHQMPVIWHDAVGEQRDRHSFKGLNKNPFEGFVVPCVEEQLMPANRSIVDMQNQVVRISKRAARHSLEVWSNISA